MLAQAHTRTTVTHEQKSAKLLPTYPEQIAATLSPRQLRAILSGQQYYLDHQNGKHLSHTDLSAWLRRKSKQWQRTRTSTEWQTYFMCGWYAALLSDPTAEKGPIRGSRIAPIKAGEPTAQIARPTFGRDDDEERRPSFDPEDYEDFGWSLKCFPLWGQYGGTFNPSSSLKGLKSTVTWPIFPLWGQNGGTFNSLAKTLLFGAQGFFGRPGWSLMKLAPEGGDGSGRNIRPHLFAGEDGDDGGWSLLFGPRDDEDEGWFGPKDDDGPGFRLLFGALDNRGGSWSLIFGPTGGDDETWKLPVFGPEDGDETGWWIAAPHDGNDDSWGDRAPLPPFGGDGEGKSLPHSSLASLDPTCDAPIRFAPDDETEERCPSFGEEGEDGGYRPLTRRSFLCIDDDDEDRSPRFGDDEFDERGGWYRRRLPRYLASQLGGGATLLPLNARSRPIRPSEPADGDGDERCPCFPLGARPAGRPTWPDDDDGNAHSPHSLTRWEGATWHKPYKS